MHTSLKWVLAAISLTIFVNCSANQQTSTPNVSAVPNSILGPIKGSGSSPLQGTVDSGGGRAVVCRDQAGALKSVRDLDLYESAHTSKLTPAPQQGSLDDEWRFFAQRFASRIPSGPLRDSTLAKILGLKEQFMKQASFVSEKEAKLKPIDDSKEVFTVDGCDIEQLANWQDDDAILVQKELWEAMPPRDQAGLIAHEFIYNTYRGLGLRSSVYPRRVVGMLFSTRPLTAFPLPSGDFTCSKSQGAENAFDVSNRIDLSLPSDGHAGTLILSSYPSQILLEPVSLELAPDDMTNAIKACRGNDRQDITLATTQHLKVHTPYFKNELSVHYVLDCGKLRKSINAGPELSLSLKSSHVGSESTYTCAANSPGST